jgi:pimeloyl-ACP methyl ester carboxylesterase
MDAKSTSAQAGASSRPALPPRQSDAQSTYSDAPPPYDAMTAFKGPWSEQDQRSSSTQSLVPSESNQQHDRRKLMLIYVHGFMGNETSFRSFPAHVHNLLTVLLAETHVVHTKIYPRYRSKKSIGLARDNFGKWLEPHEDSTTDVVLLGHSMGGLLCAEVALMRPAPPASRPLKHRILGTINFDVPFLGMHPGVVKSGLGSIFKPAEEPEDKWTPGDDSRVSPSPDRKWTMNVGRQDTLWKPESQDPNFNPSFQNDVVLPMRKGWQNALHFMKKHSDNLGKATTQLVTSHLEFGGAMANYPELKSRYGKIRALEEEDENIRKSTLKAATPPPRVRFVNYYTASTGRIKKPKSPSRLLSPSSNASRTSLSPEEAQRGRSREGHSASPLSTSRSASPQISLEEHSDEGVIKKEVEMPSSGEEDWDGAAETLTIQEPRPVEDDVADEILSPQSTLSLATTASLPPIPDLPQAPPPLDVSYIQDAETRKVVEKEHARAVKSYEKVVKDREKAIRARAKLEEKKERKARKDSENEAKAAAKAKKKSETLTQTHAEKPQRELTHNQREALRLQQEHERMEAEGRRMRGEKSPARSQEQQSVGTTTTLALAADPPTSAPPPPPLPSRSPSPSVPRTASRSPAPKKPLKDRKFCTLPPKDSNGERDPLWVRVFMENVDEVGAHCGLFFVDERYERLVGEVADRIEGWVREDADFRAIRDFDGKS